MEEEGEKQKRKCSKTSHFRELFHTVLLTNDVVRIVAIECHPANNWTLIRSTGWFSNDDNKKKVYMVSEWVCCAKLLRTVTSYKDFATTERIYCAPMSARFDACACVCVCVLLTWAFVFHMQGQLLSMHTINAKYIYPLESDTHTRSRLLLIRRVCSSFSIVHWRVKSATSKFFNLLFIAHGHWLFAPRIVHYDMTYSGRLNLLQFLNFKLSCAFLFRLLLDVEIKLIVLTQT